MAMRQLLLSMLISLVAVAVVRWRARRAGRAALARAVARAVLVAAAIYLVSGAGAGGALASNGDRNGSSTGTTVQNVVPLDQQTSRTVPTLEDVTAQTEKNRVSINIVWLMMGGVLVLFMQAGFALVETGFTRAKNAAHTMMMNMVIFAIGVVGWFVCGYALMFGSTDQSYLLGVTALGHPWHFGVWNVLAHSGFFLGGKAYDVSILAFFFFQLVFMDATATIPTGAMAERWKFSSFCVWGLFASMILYP
ncbi:MAG: ammonium transporter, Amt family, partial [Actinomycetota bacterium]|nr:ammonium transporter, Amt family [Actinomycetota bacterium]